MQTRFIQNSIWENMVVAGFLSLLEGFSRISSCSTEGRALMSMDLATFTSEVTSPKSMRNRVESIFGESIMKNKELELSSPPAATVSRGMKYVDIYVKVFYFNKEVCGFANFARISFGLQLSTFLTRTILLVKLMNLLGCNELDFR